MIQRADKKPAAIYLRRSTDKQEQSLGDQRAEDCRYVDAGGFDVVVPDYVDDAISGTSADGRAAFLRMIADAQRPDCPFRHIIVYDIKRFGRGDLDEAGYYRHLLRQHGVEVHYAAEGFTGQSSDDIVRAVKQFQARDESVGLSRVTIRGLLSRVRAGCWPGGQPPYGYDLEYSDSSGRALFRVRYLDTGEKHVIYPGEGPARTLDRGQRVQKSKSDTARLVLSAPERVQVVREMADMSLQRGMGFKSIAAELNARGIPSPRNGNWSTRTHPGWSASTVRSILVNPIYAGDMVWNRRTAGKLHRISGGRAVPCDKPGKKTPTWNDEADFEIIRDTHPAILDRATWAALQRTREARHQSRCGESFRGGRAKDSPHLLVGLIQCPRCGHKYGGYLTPKGKRRVDGSRVETRYYMCYGYRMKGPSVCEKVLIPAPALEDGVVAHVEQRVVDFLLGGGEQLVRDGLTVAAKHWLEQHAPDPKAIEDRLQAIRADAKRLLASITPLNAKYLDEEIVALQREREALEGQLEQIRVSKATAPDVGRMVDEIVAQMQDFQAVFKEGTPEEKKEFIRLFVEGIELDVEKKVARCRIKKFPAPNDLDAGKLSFGLVAGARDEQQQIVFPPVDIVEIPLVSRGTVLVPLAA